MTTTSYIRLAALTSVCVLSACITEPPRPQPEPSETSAQPGTTAPTTSGSGKAPAKKLSFSAAYALDLGDVHLKYNQLKRAKSVYQVVLAKRTKLAGRAEYGMALVETKLGNIPAALEHYEKAISHWKDPQKTALRLKQAQLLRQAKRFAEAEAQLEQILSGKAPKPTRTTCLRELVALHKGRLPLLVKKTVAHVQKNPTDRERQAFLGDLYAEVLSSPKKAVAVYQNMLKSEPSNLVLLDRIVSLSTKAKLWDLAIRYGEVLAKALPDPRARLALLKRLVNLYTKTKRYPKARATLARCIRLATPDEQVNLRVAGYRVLKVEGKLPAVITRLEKESRPPKQAPGTKGPIKRADSAIQSLTELFFIHMLVVTDLTRGLAIAETLLRERPKTPLHALWVIQVATRLKKHERVAAVASRVLAERPAIARSVLAPYASSMAKLGRAKAAQKTLLAIAAKHQGQRPYVLLAIAGLERSKKARAPWLTKAIAATRALKSPTVYQEVAVVLNRAGSPDRALALVREGLKLNPKGPALRGLQSQQLALLESMGRYGDGVAYCRRLAQDPRSTPKIRRQAREISVRLQKKLRKKP